MAEVNALKYLRDFVATFPTQKDAARTLKITPAYLSDLVNGRRDVSPRMLKKLGLKIVVVTT